MLLGTDHQHDSVDSFDKLEKAIAFLDKEGEEIILLGDTNCDLAKKSADQALDNNAKHISSSYELFSFKQLIKEPTRVTFILSYFNTKPYQLKKKRETIQMSIYTHIKSYNFAGLPRDRASGRMLIL